MTRISEKSCGAGRITPHYCETALESDIVLLGLSEAEALFGERNPDKVFDLLFQKGARPLRGDQKTAEKAPGRRTGSTGLSLRRIPAAVSTRLGRETGSTPDF